MSQLGQSRRFDPGPSTSGIPSQADIAGPATLVRCVPTTDILPTSINDLVGAHEERRRDREAKRLGGSHVDDEV
jgi:hypothetical protein